MAKDNMDEAVIAITSLTFLINFRNNGECVQPVSSLPFPKNVMIRNIEKFTKFAIYKHEFALKEVRLAKDYYSLLSNFIPDDQAHLVNEVNGELEKIEKADKGALQKWLSDPNNKKRKEKVEKIISSVNEERNLLQTKFDSFIKTNT